MPHLDRNGVRIYYEVHGEGPTILLSHGYSATSRMWANQASALSSAYRVITWDMRGHGRSDSPLDPSAYSEALTVDDMAALLDACGADRAVIGGLSLGGYMSLAFHVKYPERVRALMLFDTGPGFKKGDAREKWNERAEQWAFSFETRGLEALSEVSSDEMDAHQHDDPEGLALAARGMLKQFDSRIIESLPNVRVPALVLVGADDLPFIAATDYMAAKIPDAAKVVIPNAGHAANLHQPAAFNRVVVDFLGGLAAASA